MRVIIKPIENFKKLIKEVTGKNRKALNEWFYNAKDENLKEAIFLMNSKEMIEVYPRQYLKEYIKFARKLLRGELPQPPTDLDLWSDSNINYYKFAQGSYQLFFLLQSQVNHKQKILFRKCSLMAVAQKSLFSSRRQLVLIRHLASFCRIINSRLLISFKLSLNILIQAFSLPHPQPILPFKSKAQNKKLKLKVLREMIKKGRVNLEQRAFWTWKIIYNESQSRTLTTLKHDFSLLRLVAHSANLRYFHCVKSKFDKWKQVRPELPIFSLLSTSPDSPFRSSSKSVLQYSFKKKLKRGLVGVTNCAYSRLEFSLNQIKRFAEFRSLDLYRVSQLMFIKPFLKNLVHLHSRRLLEVFERWKEGLYEYEYEETVVTVSNQKKNFKVGLKPAVPIEFYDDCKNNKILLRNMAHILHRKLCVYWNRWVRFRKSDLNQSGDAALDLAMFKLPFVRFEKLRMVVAVLMDVAEGRKNLPRVVMTNWMQVTNKRNLTVQKLKIIFQNQMTSREVKKHAFTAFQLCNQFQTEFTDIV